MHSTGNEPGMPTFLAIAALAALALTASGPRFRRLRRSRIMTALFGGGWLAVAAGAFLGPGGVGAINTEHLLRLTPLLMIGLGWIGLLVGLQARRDVLAAVPRVVWRIVWTDALMSVTVFGALAWVWLGLWIGEEGGRLEAAWRLPAVVLIGACSIGWSMETRSLRRSDEAASARLAAMVRGAGALGAILSITLFGVASQMTTRAIESGAMRLDWTAGAVRLAVSLAAAIVLALLGRHALRQAGRSRPELLVVFLGLMALSAGVAADLSFSPLLGAMLVGVALANLGGASLEPLHRFVMESEHVVALFFALLAGAMMDVHIGVWGVLLALSMVAARLMLKPAALRLGALGRLDMSDQRSVSGHQAETETTSVSEALPASSPLYVAPVRQGPLAVAMAVGLAIAEPSALSQRLLTVVVLAGLLSEVTPLAIALLRHPVDSDSKLAGVEGEA